MLSYHHCLLLLEVRRFLLCLVYNSLFVFSLPCRVHFHYQFCCRHHPYYLKVFPFVPVVFSHSSTNQDAVLLQVRKHLQTQADLNYNNMQSFQVQIRNQIALFPSLHLPLLLLLPPNALQQRSFYQNNCSLLLKGLPS